MRKNFTLGTIVAILATAFMENCVTTTSGDQCSSPTKGLSQSSSSSTSHNAGQACLGCHNGGTATAFTLGGTLYTAATGGVVDSGRAGTKITVNAGVNVTVDSCGNFFSKTATPATTAGVIQVVGGAGGTMGAHATPANCNSTGCHADKSADPSSNGRIF